MGYFIGVDVGSGSARAGIFDSQGHMISNASYKIQQFKPETDHVEQSSKDIWYQVCRCVKSAISKADIDPLLIKGIGFDATCSLVALDKNDEPISISTENNDSHNIVMWMDHRAIKEASEINRTESYVLNYVGKKVSPEMELPKILWIKKYLPEQYKKIATFLDLADFLVFKATAKITRSVCTMSCKWNYLSHKSEWDLDFLAQIGLDDLISSGKVEGTIKPLGSTGHTLSEVAAQELNLHTGVAVAVGIIDAHAGGLAMMNENPEETLAIIAGTSSCHMAQTQKETLIEGVWGGYYDAMLPKYWLQEGGQSATGALIDHVITSSSYYKELTALAKSQNDNIYQVLNTRITELEAQNPELMRNFHMLGYHHGNRSPRADATLKGMISGLSLSNNIDDLAIQYLAAIQSIAYGTKHIIEKMIEKGINISSIKMCGGDTKNPIFLREHADITGLNINLLAEPEAVLLGSAIMGAVAAGEYDNFEIAIANMSQTGMQVIPNTKKALFHQQKFQVFKEMYKDQVKYKKLMNPLGEE